METTVRDRFARFFSAKREASPEVTNGVSGPMAAYDREEALYSNEVQDEAPLRVRGHHVKVLQEVLRSDETSTFGVRKFVNVHSRFLEIQRDLGEKEIYADTVGNTPEEENRFKTKNIFMYTKFMSLPDEATVELVEGQKDMICDGCAIGKHCTFRSHENFGMGPDVLADDRRGVDGFLQKAWEYGVNEEKMSKRYEMATFEDANPEMVRVIKTTVGTVKNILRRTQPQDWE